MPSRILEVEKEVRNVARHITLRSQSSALWCEAPEVHESLLQDHGSGEASHEE